MPAPTQYGDWLIPALPKYVWHSRLVGIGWYQLFFIFILLQICIIIRKLLHRPTFQDLFCCQSSFR